MNATHLRNMFMPHRGRRDDWKTNGQPELPIDRRAYRDDKPLRRARKRYVGRWDCLPKSESLLVADRLSHFKDRSRIAFTGSDPSRISREHHPYPITGPCGCRSNRKAMCSVAGESDANGPSNLSRKASILKGIEALPGRSCLPWGHQGIAASGSQVADAVSCFPWHLRAVTWGEGRNLAGPQRPVRLQ